MKKTLKHTTLAAAALIAFASSSAYAQAKQPVSFTGLGMGASFASSKNKLEIDPAITGSFEGTDSAADLIGSYGFNMGSQWVGTVGMAVGIKSTSFGTYVETTSNNNATTKQHFALSFAPGLRIGNDGLVYGKLAFHQLSVNYTSTSGFDDTKTHTGTGIGMGYAYAVSPQMEIRGELESVNYGTQKVGTSDTTPKMSSLGVSLLYKF
ncbi:MAG: porin family protein [Betaproteobacteria bacterium]|nr:porin family protein [Betaproteobacteria bacterium]